MEEGFNLAEIYNTTWAENVLLIHNTTAFQDPIISQYKKKNQVSSYIIYTSHWLMSKAF